MKTQKQINADITYFRKWSGTGINERKKMPAPAIKGKPESVYSFLTKLLLYLQTNPTIEFVETQLDMVEKEIAMINSYYQFFNPQEMEFKSERAKMTYYFNLHEMPKLRLQQRALRYLLKNEKGAYKRVRWDSKEDRCLILGYRTNH